MMKVSAKCFKEVRLLKNSIKSTCKNIGCHNFFLVKKSEGFQKFEAQQSFKNNSLRSKYRGEIMIFALKF